MPRYSAERKFAVVEGYIDATVLDEAKRRIRDILARFDTVVASFSGGKDSLVILHLIREVKLELGDDSPVPVLFWDEEVIPTPVIDFVDQYRRTDWVDMTWLAIPLGSTKYVLGDVVPYTQWDPDREWVRPRPAWALTETDLGIPVGRKYTQFQMSKIVESRWPGSVCLVNGIRAAESPMRRRAVLSKLHDCYLNAGDTPKVARAKPIYDWSENDVFRYFYDRGITYCSVYDAQMWSRTRLRVATPLVAEAAKYLDVMRELDGEFYDRLCHVWPDVAAQARYGKSMVKADLGDQYADGWEGIERWITEQIGDPSTRSLARRRLREVRRQAELNPLGYQPSYVLRGFVNGEYKRTIVAEQPYRATKRRQKEAAAREAADG